MSKLREKLQTRSKQFARVLGAQSDGSIKNIWSFGSLPNGKKRPRDSDMAVEIVATAAARDKFIELKNMLAPHKRFGGISIHAVPVTSIELESGKTEVAQSVQKHRIKLWPL